MSFFCDISKAFDRVWHKGLLVKLQQLGIADQLLKWISNYLEDRQQRLSSGVPQGSVLGPLLFLTFVIDITDNLLSITRLFADDTSLASSTSNIED